MRREAKLLRLKICRTFSLLKQVVQNQIFIVIRVVHFVLFFSDVIRARIDGFLFLEN